MYQAIVFLPLLGFIIAGLISLTGAHQRYPGAEASDDHGHGHDDHAHAHAAAAHADRNGLQFRAAHQQRQERAENIQFLQPVAHQHHPTLHHNLLPPSGANTANGGIDPAMLYPTV